MDMGQADLTSPVEVTAEKLIACIRNIGSVAIAYSGGVDSAVVAKAAVLAMGSQAVAVTAVSPSLAESERVIARDEASHIGIRHVELATLEFDRAEYRRNAGDRCFFCKDTLYAMVASNLAALGVGTMINGANADDLGDHRPGMKAATDYQVRSPLIEIGAGKQTVRELARYWCLTVADKPASPCLSSRIAYGVEVTPERVARVEAAEAFLKDQTGIGELRVRMEAGEVARIEIPLSALPRLVETEVRQATTEKLRSLGFRFVTLDLDGFRSGSLNAALPILDSLPTRSL